jgi:hypothetical protein
MRYSPHSVECHSYHVNIHRVISTRFLIYVKKNWQFFFKYLVKGTVSTRSDRTFQCHYELKVQEATQVPSRHYVTRSRHTAFRGRSAYIRVGLTAKQMLYVFFYGSSDINCDCSYLRIGVGSYFYFRPDGSISKWPRAEGPRKRHLQYKNYEIIQKLFTLTEHPLGAVE